MSQPTFNLNEAHEYFSAELFNTTWEYIEQADDRSTEEEMTMLHLAMASLWHWTQRQDVKVANLYASYWQVSRVYNLLRQPDNARTYGLLALKHAENLDPFFKGYAYETLARAEMQLGNRAVMKDYLEKAKKMVDKIEDQGDKQLLLRDLATIK